MSKKRRGNLMLFLTAFIWGTAFVAQVEGMEYLGPFSFNGIRSFIAAFALLVLIFILDRQAQSKQALQDNSLSQDTQFNGDTDIAASDIHTDSSGKTLLISGICCGVFLFGATSLQQFGMQFTTAGKAGFITALYIVIVPICGLFLHKKVRKLVWGCVVIAAIGLYLLCIKEDFSINRGDFLVLICAIVFSGHILVIDYFSPKTNGIKMSCIQFFVCGLLSLIPIALSESVEWQNILLSWKPLLYSGVLSGAVAYTLQIVAQKDTDPTIASLILSLESVFAVLAGIILLNESLTLRELVGCILMFVAIIIVQLPERKKESTL